jgi:hypothetical protein
MVGGKIGHTKREAEEKEKFWITYYNPSLNTNKKINKYNII